MGGSRPSEDDEPLEGPAVKSQDQPQCESLPSQGSEGVSGIKPTYKDAQVHEHLQAGTDGGVQQDDLHVRDPENLPGITSQNQVQGNCESKIHQDQHDEHYERDHHQGQQEDAMKELPGSLRAFREPPAAGEPPQTLQPSKSLQRVSRLAGSVTSCNNSNQIVSNLVQIGTNCMK